MKIIKDGRIVVSFTFFDHPVIQIAAEVADRLVLSQSADLIENVNRYSSCKQVL